VLLPLIVYTLVQHLVAGGAAALLGRGGAGEAAASPETSPALEREATV
jgi:hypothetical protein